MSPAARRQACFDAGRCIDAVLPDTDTLTGNRRLAAEVAATWSLSALCYQLGTLVGEDATDPGAVARRLADVERITGDLLTAARAVAAAKAKPRAGKRRQRPLTGAGLLLALGSLRLPAMKDAAGAS